MENHSSDEKIHINELRDEQLKLIAWHANVGTDRMTEVLDPIMRDPTLSNNNKFSACLLSVAGVIHNLKEIYELWGNSETTFESMFERIRHIDECFQRGEDDEG